MGIDRAAAAAARDPRVIEAAFPGIDFTTHRVSCRIAQAIATIEAAVIEAGPRPGLRRAVEPGLVDVRERLLWVLRTARAPRPPEPGPAAGVLALPPAAGQ